MKYAPTKKEKIVFFDRFFDEKSVFGWVGNDFGKEKSEVKKLPIFPKKTDFSRKKIKIFPGSKNMEKLLLKGFEPTQNAWNWHSPTTKPLIAIIIYNANFFYIILLFICS